MTAFHDLPFELREMVFKYAWTDTAISLCHQDIEIMAYTTTSFRDYKVQLGLPRWISTCRMMLQEGIRVFQRTRIFATFSYEFLIRLPGYRLRTNESCIDNRLVINSGIQHIELGAYTLLTHWDATPRLYWTPEIQQDVFLEYLGTLELRNVHLTCHVVAGFENEIQQNYARLRYTSQLQCLPVSRLTLRLSPPATFTVLERHLWEGVGCAAISCASTYICECADVTSEHVAIQMEKDGAGTWCFTATMKEY